MSGITNNQSEGFNYVFLKRMQEWKEIPIASAVLLLIIPSSGVILE